MHVLYHEGPCLVVNKPGGVLTQAPPHIDSMERRLKEYIREQEQKSGNVYLGVPHRLDRPVSGALVVARHVRAARRLSQQFEARTVRKVYWAWVEGNVTDDEGAWEDYVRKIPQVAHAEVVDSETEDAKHARLTFRVLDRRAEMTLLEIELQTGRMHQIRVQASHRRHPIIGDEQYGASLSYGPETEEARQRWIGLHGRQLEFLHPMTKEPVAVTAPLPKYWPSAT